MEEVAAHRSTLQLEPDGGDLLSGTRLTSTINFALQHNLHKLLVRDEYQSKQTHGWKVWCLDMR
jgi:hypothetical protein